jgi:LacI family transcriptional regulator
LAPKPENRGATTKATPTSIGAVARIAGVSTATVSRILNGKTGKASPETIARVMQVVAETGYRPSSAGQALRRRESRLVALIASNLANPIMSAIAASVEVALRHKGQVMVLCDSHDRPDLQDEYLREMKAHAVRGFVLLGAVRSPALKAMLEEGEPVVFVNRSNPYGTAAPFVGIDNRQAGADVADLFARLGYRRILVIHASLDSSATRDRVEGFLAAFQRQTGLTADVEGGQSVEHLELGHDCLKRYVRATGKVPDAVFCLSDLIAYGATRALKDLGGSGSAECQVVGFDDSPLNDWIIPDLSSVSVPYAGFGTAVTDVLEALWEGGRNRSIILPHRLAMRGPIAQAASSSAILEREVKNT